MKTFFSLYRNVLLIALVLLFAATVIPTMIGLSPNIVLSSSMEPHIPVGSLSYIDIRENVNDITIGDVIAFKTGDKKVIHRVIKIEPESQTIITKGDNNENPDNPITYNDYCGRVVLHLPMVGYVIHWMQTSIGIVIIVCMLIIAIASSVIYKDMDYQSADIVTTDTYDATTDIEPADNKRHKIIKRASKYIQNGSHAK